MALFFTMKSTIVSLTLLSALSACAVKEHLPTQPMTLQQIDSLTYTASIFVSNNNGNKDSSLLRERHRIQITNYFISNNLCNHNVGIAGKPVYIGKVQNSYTLQYTVICNIPD